MTDDFAELDATAQAELVRLGQVRSSDLVDAAIARVEALDPQLNAFTTTRFDRARTEAAGELPEGPFRGVPFALKDLSCTLAGEPAYDGVPVLAREDYRAEITSNLAARFLAAGLVVIGRTGTPELGIMPTTEPLAFGPTHNPWKLGRTPGGSSGGSAAAVAAGIVPFAHASDGGGSIRIPAACCGLVGLKTSRVAHVGRSGEQRARLAAVRAVRGDPLGPGLRCAPRRGRGTVRRRPRHAATTRVPLRVGGEHRAVAAPHRAHDDQARHEQ